LKGIHLKIERGMSVAIKGASGSGKSTLLQIISTLENPTSGIIKFEGKEISASFISQFRSRHLGFVFQSANLLDDYTLLDNILLKAKVARAPTDKKSEAYETAIELIEILGLSERRDFPVKYLSGGEKQRAAIARAFMNDPDIIMADEPTGNLDQDTASFTKQLLLNITKKFSKSLLLVTHDLNFANLTDEIFELKSGILNKIK
jgi:lipoprotein-releasing system ATP-binding protein